jgi:hypothetical protein
MRGRFFYAALKDERLVGRAFHSLEEGRKFAGSAESFAGRERPPCSINMSTKLDALPWAMLDTEKMEYVDSSFMNRWGRTNVHSVLCSRHCSHFFARIVRVRGFSCSRGL